MRAWALVTNVTLAAGGDAIAVDTEHVEGAAIRAVLPYQMRGWWFLRRPRYGALEAEISERRVWLSE